MIFKETYLRVFKSVKHKWLSKAPGQQSLLELRKEKEKLCRQWNHSLHRFRKRRHIGLMSRESPPPDYAYFLSGWQCPASPAVNW